MTDVQPIDETAFEPHLKAPEIEPAFLCTVCGTNRATHILTALDDPNVDLFCSACIIVTFAQIANEMGSAAA